MPDGSCPHAPGYGVISCSTGVGTCAISSTVSRALRNISQGPRSLLISERVHDSVKNKNYVTFAVERGPSIGPIHILKVRTTFIPTTNLRLLYTIIGFLGIKDV